MGWGRCGPDSPNRRHDTIVTRGRGVVPLVRERADGHLELFQKFAGGSSRGGLGNLILSKILKGHWDKISVEQIGSAGLVVLEPDASVDLLTLTLPEDLMDEARKSLPGDPIIKFLPTLFRLHLGPDAL